MLTRDRWTLVLACLAGGGTALCFGFVPEWDLLNYHLYNPHALLNGRLAIDLAPAQQQTFLNPAFFIPVYLLFEHFGPATLVFVMGAVQAGQVLLLLMILEELVGQRINNWWMLLVAAAVALGGPIFLNQLGSTQGDTVISALVLGGLLLLLRELRRSGDSESFRSGFLAGLMLGVACALKLTMALYAVSLGLAVILYFGGMKRWRVATSMALGGFLGVLLAAGAWFAYLYQAYGSPLFPYFNNVFASTWIDQGDYRDLRFMPGSPLEWLLYPWFWLRDPQRVWEFNFFDLRTPLLIAAVFILPLFSWRKMRERSPALGFAWLFIALSYLLWIRLFSIYRYLSVVELLAPVILFSSVAILVRARWALIITLLALVGSQTLVEYHRGQPAWDFRPDAVTRLSTLPANSMVLIDGYEPVAYAAIWLDNEVPLVRIRANFMRTAEPRFRFQQHVQDTVKNHNGPYFLLLKQEDVEGGLMEEDLRQVGLRLARPEDCEDVFDSVELQQQLGLKLCSLDK